MTNVLAPADDAATLEDLKQHVHAARLRAQRQANTELLKLWCRIGRTILDRQDEQGWGTKVLERLASDLRAEFPSVKGFSRMRQVGSGVSASFSMIGSPSSLILFSG